MGIRIDELPAAANVQADHDFPAMRAGETVKLTAEQLATFIIALVTDSAPVTLDTLNELAAALGDDPNFATTVTNALAAKASLTGAETLTDKTLTSPVVNNPQLTLVQSSSPTPTVEGRVEWDTDNDRLVVGTGSGQAIFGQVTPWVAYTPTFTAFGTVSNVAFRSRRVGGNIEIIGRFTSGTCTATEARISLGFNEVDGGVSVASFMNSGNWLVGDAAPQVSATTFFGVCVLATGGNNYMKFGAQTSTSNASVAAVGNSVSGDTTSFLVRASIPIEGW